MAPPSRRRRNDAAWPTPRRFAGDTGFWPRWPAMSQRRCSGLSRAISHPLRCRSGATNSGRRAPHVRKAEIGKAHSFRQVDLGDHSATGIAPPGCAPPGCGAAAIIATPGSTVTTANEFCRNGGIAICCVHAQGGITTRIPPVASSRPRQVNVHRAQLQRQQCQRRCGRCRESARRVHHVATKTYPTVLVGTRHRMHRDSVPNPAC